METKKRRLARFFGISQFAFQQIFRRVVFLSGGLCVGGAAVLMALAADKAQDGFLAAVRLEPRAALFLPPLGFAISAYLALKIFPNSQGSGIPQVIAAREVIDPKQKLSLVSLKIAFGKIILMTFALFCGASIGREGPTVQVGAAIMAAIGRKAEVTYQSGLLLAGAAAGISAAFNTPLAGIVFGIEELSRSYQVETSGLVLGCIIAAGITSLALLGDYTYFGSTAAVLPLGKSWLIVPLCGLIGGLIGGSFSGLLILFAYGLPGALGRAIKRRPVSFAFVCGAVLSACGYISGNTVFGTGYEQARAILHGDDHLSPLFMMAKFFATVVSSISGIPGGLFAPSLAVGAGLGANLHVFFENVPVGALTLIGMVAYLSGVVQAPITSFVIVSEMTEDHAMIIPLMVAAVIATTTSKFIYPDGIYHTLSLRFVHPGLKPPGREKTVTEKGVSNT
jgi:H+/Cl- antiporter ClcA